MHGEIFGDHHDMESDPVSGGVRTVDEFQFRRMREDRLGDERGTGLDEVVAGGRGQPGRVVGVGFRGVGPLLPGDQVGVHEGCAHQRL